MTAEEIAHKFDVSVLAAKIRLVEIEKMRRRSVGAKRPLPESVIKFLQEQKKKGHQVSCLDEDE